MSEKKHYKRIEWRTTNREMREGSAKYVEAIAKILEKLSSARNPMEVLAKEIVLMGYAVGVIAGKASDAGIVAYVLLLDGIMLSLHGEERKEKMIYAIWDQNGVLYSSEEGAHVEEGGEP